MEKQNADRETKSRTELPRAPMGLPVDPSETFNPERSSHDASRIDALVRASRPPGVAPDSDQGPPSDTPALLNRRRRSSDITPLPPGGISTNPAPTPFQLRRLVGRGGVGEVWEAVQASLRRVIAVKRLREDLAATISKDDQAARLMELAFQREAFTTARLDHPNIVPVHELGYDEFGLPLLAMKLVRGKPWHEVIREDFVSMKVPDFLGKHLPTLIDVCQAVSFAHSRGIIHRDIKPSQVMVGAYGEVLLMDWGIAVVFDSRRAEADGVAFISPATAQLLSAASAPAGTAAYMAPEQTESTVERLGPWTDVYLLGGCLYYLLTGTSPHRAPDAASTFAMAQRGIVDPPELRAPDREIPAELSDIAMRAMAPDPIERYQTAAEFLGALQDYLTGAGKRRESEAITEAVRARVASLDRTYRELSELQHELVRAQSLWPGNPDVEPLRQRVMFEYATLAIENKDLQLARAQAERLRRGTERDAVFVRIENFESWARIYTYQRVGALAVCVLLMAAVTWLGVDAQRQAEQALELRQEAMMSHERAVMALQRYEQQSAVAVAEAERAGRAESAARQSEREARNAQARAKDSLERAQSLINFLLVDLRRGLEPLGRMDLLQQVALKVQTYFDGVGGGEMDARDAPLRALLQTSLGDVYLSSGEPDKALTSYISARTLYASIASRSRDNLAAQSDLAQAHSRVGSAFAAKRNLTPAREAFNEATAILRGLVASEPFNATWRTQLVLTLGNMTDFFLEQRQFDEALAHQLESQRIARAELERRPDDSAWQRNLAAATMRLGDVYRSMNRGEQADDAYRESFEILSWLNRSARNRLIPEYQRDLSDAQVRIGLAARSDGKLDEALAALDEARAIRRNLVGLEPTNVSHQHRLAESNVELSETLSLMGRQEEAAEAAEESLRILSHYITNETRTPFLLATQARGFECLGDAMRRAEKPREAEAALRRARTIYERLITLDPGTTQWREVLSRLRGRIEKPYPSPLEQVGPMEMGSSVRVTAWVSNIVSTPNLERPTVLWLCDEVVSSVALEIAPDVMAGIGTDSRPAVGDRITAFGVVGGTGARPRLLLLDPRDFQVNERASAPPTIVVGPVRSELTDVNLGAVDRPLTVTGWVVARIPSGESEGLERIWLADKFGNRAIICYRTPLQALFGRGQVFHEGDWLAVAGVVIEHRGDAYLEVRNADDLRTLERGTAPVELLSPDPVRISARELQLARLAQRVRLRGQVVSIQEDASANVIRVTVKDATDEAVVAMWKPVFEAATDSRRIAVGSMVEVTGLVDRLPEGARLWLQNSVDLRVPDDSPSPSPASNPGVDGLGS